MRLLIIPLITLSSCGFASKSHNPIQVERSVLTIDRVESHYRGTGDVYYIIWTDSKGTEYQEKIKRPSDTAWAKKGKSLAQLLKR